MIYPRARPAGAMPGGVRHLAHRQGAREAGEGDGVVGDRRSIPRPSPRFSWTPTRWSPGPRPRPPPPLPPRPRGQCFAVVATLGDHDEEAGFPRDPPGDRSGPSLRDTSAWCRRRALRPDPRDAARGGVSGGARRRPQPGGLADRRPAAGGDRPSRCSRSPSCSAPTPKLRARPSPIKPRSRRRSDLRHDGDHPRRPGPRRRARGGYLLLLLRRLPRERFLASPESYLSGPGGAA